MARAANKDEREIRTNDKELKAIHTIQKALAGLDSQAAGRVLTFCIDRARQSFEQSLKAQVGEAARDLRPPVVAKERIPDVVEPARALAVPDEPAVLGAGVGA